PLVAQSPSSLAQVEERSYALYQQQAWDSLLSYGEQALDHGIDYYYLRLRMGIAAYELGAYKKARQHLLVASNYQPEDPYLNDLLAYTYLQLGWSLEAHQRVPW
ncbi:hypothetical protein RZS08_00555, partial [Arthrospira platensis SPKY1]|nr:hypothetical protein [Arthrospira platensis SPKY1]